jgi:hypothetical protein
MATCPICGGYSPRHELNLLPGARSPLLPAATKPPTKSTDRRGPFLGYPTRLRIVATLCRRLGSVATTRRRRSLA